MFAAPFCLQEYTFTLTQGDGARVQGFCRRFLPPAPRLGSKLRYPQVLCLVCEASWSTLFFKASTFLHCCIGISNPSTAVNSSELPLPCFSSCRTQSSWQQQQRAGPVIYAYCWHTQQLLLAVLAGCLPLAGKQQPFLLLWPLCTVGAGGGRAAAKAGRPAAGHGQEQAAATEQLRRAVSGQPERSTGADAGAGLCHTVRFAQKLTT